MRVWLQLGAVVAALLLGGLRCAGQTTDTVSCVARLELPQYTNLLRDAQIQGYVEVGFTVGVDGTASRVVVKSTHELLKRLVANRIEKSRFRRDCSGQGSLGGCERRV